VEEGTFDASLDFIFSTEMNSTQANFIFSTEIFPQLNSQFSPKITERTSLKILPTKTENKFS